MKLAEMSDEELFEVSLQKNKKGCATKEALRTQSMLNHRNNSFYGRGMAGRTLDMDGKSYKGLGD